MALSHLITTVETIVLVFIRGYTIRHVISLV